jgi:DNA-binding MarR family transcriptional regulator
MRARNTIADRTNKELPKTYDESLGFLIARAFKSLNKRFLKIVGDFGVTAPQAGVLGRLFEEDGLSASELKARLFSDSSTIVAIVDRLEGKGLLTREDDPQDRRVNRLCLTDKAKKMQPEFMSRIGEFERAIRNVLSQQEIRVLKTGLEKIYLFAEIESEKPTYE